MTRRLLVLGPIAQWAIVTTLIAAALVFYGMGDRLQSGAIVGAVLSRVLSLLPVARGRPGDVAKVVTRRMPTPLPLPPPRDDEL